MSLGVHATGVTSRTSPVSASSVSFLSSFGSTKTVQQPLASVRHSLSGHSDPKGLLEVRSPETVANQIHRGSSGGQERCESSNTVSPQGNFEVIEAVCRAEAPTATGDVECLTTKLSCSQQLLMECQQREKSLQYKLRQLESEVQILRASRPQLVVRIGRQRTDPRSKSYVQYEVCIERCNSTSASQVVQYSLWRRYSQFFEMHRQLAKQCPQDARRLIPRLPPKSWSGNMEAAFVETRAKELHWYLQLLSSVDPLRRCQAFRDFLLPNSGNGVFGGDVATGERSIIPVDSTEALAMLSIKSR